MSRQMAFQFTGLQFMEYAQKLVALPKFEGSMSLGDWIDRHVQDPKEREKLAAVYIILDRCQKERLDFSKIRKMIVWRDKDGKAKDIETEFMPDAKLPAPQVPPETPFTREELEQLKASPYKIPKAQVKEGEGP